MKRVGVLSSAVLCVVALAWAIVALAQPSGGDWLLHVSYDPTRELYRSMNKAFADDYYQRTGRKVVVRQSHSGSASQARAVNEGLPADVLSLAIQPDLEAVANGGLVAKDWRDRLPHQATPFHSTIVFVVRKGNRTVRDWPDLVRPELPLQIVTPNPKTSGNGKLSLLAAWGAAIRRGCSESEAEAVLKAMLARAPVLDPSARAATVTFAQKNIGDVHLTFESEAALEVAESRGALEIVYPKSGSLRVEPPIAWVDRTAKRRGTETLARDYLNFIFSPAGQRIGAELSYRPSDPRVAAEIQGKLPSLRLFTLEDVGLDWDKANKKFFASGAMFDRIAAELAGVSAVSGVSHSNRGVLPGFRGTLGFAVGYLTVFVVLPLAFCLVKAGSLSTEEFLAAAWNPRARAAYLLTFGASLAAAVINLVFGTIVAWVLVRYEFPLKRFVDSLIDLPFALPTAVAGLVYSSLYVESGWLGRFLVPMGIKAVYTPLGVVLVLVFIGLPFVVRAVQPVLESIDRELEEAAAALGASRWQSVVRVVLPTLLPAMITGFALALARSLGEYGSVVFVSGNLPYRTEIAPVLIYGKLEEFRYADATAIATVLLAASFAMLALINRLERWSQRRYG